MPVFQSFLPVADQPQHLVAVSYEPFPLVDVHIVLGNETVVLKRHSRHVLQVVLLREFLQAVADLKDAASLLDLADHLSDDVQEGIVLDQLPVVGSAFLAVDHQHQIKRRKKSHPQRVNIGFLVSVFQVVNANGHLAFLWVSVEIFFLGAGVSRGHSIGIVNIGVRPQNEAFLLRRVVNM